MKNKVNKMCRETLKILSLIPAESEKKKNLHSKYFEQLRKNSKCNLINKEP